MISLLRVSQTAALILSITTSTALSGTFGQTQQLFAQYGVGGPAETVLNVHNPGGEEITVAGEFFRPDGSSLAQVDIVVPAGGTEDLVLSAPEQPVRDGWMRLSAPSPFNATVFFRIAGVGNVGVPPSQAGTKFKIFTFVGEGVDTGFALANPSPTQSAVVTMRAFDTEGTLRKEVEQTYGPGEHEALFVTEPLLQLQGDGLVEFEATNPVILLSLRTDDNLLTSTALLQPEGDGSIEPGSITTELLADGAVTAPKIANGAVVRSLNGLTDEVALAAGDNVTITSSGPTLTIAASGGGGGGGDITAVNAGDGLMGGASAGEATLSLEQTISNYLGELEMGLRVESAAAGPNIVLGGQTSVVDGEIFAATIGGGRGHSVRAHGATIGGGENHAVSGSSGTVGGGIFNQVREQGGSGVISGGNANVVNGNFGTVGGGQSNVVNGNFGTVGGGQSNVSDGRYATVPGGSSNTAAGRWALAAGRRAKALDDGAFVWADDTNADFSSTGAKQFLIRAAGGVGINTNDLDYTMEVVGNRIRLRDSSAGGAKAVELRVDGNAVDINATNGNLFLKSNDGNTILQDSGGRVGIRTSSPQGTLDVNGSIYQRGGSLHADYVFEDDYELESIEEHSESMWREKHLPAVTPVRKDENGEEYVEYGSRMRGILEELEKAHIYIEQLNSKVKRMEQRLADLER